MAARAGESNPCSYTGNVAKIPVVFDDISGYDITIFLPLPKEL